MIGVALVREGPRRLVPVQRGGAALVLHHVRVEHDDLDGVLGDALRGLAAVVGAVLPLLHAERRGQARELDPAGVGVAVGVLRRGRGAGPGAPGTAAGGPSGGGEQPGCHQRAHDRRQRRRASARSSNWTSSPLGKFPYRFPRDYRTRSSPEQVTPGVRRRTVRARPRLPSRPPDRGALMTMPTDIGAVDLMIGFPVADHAAHLRLPASRMLRDAGSGEMEIPAEYMFKDVPNRLERGRRPRRRHPRRDGQVRRRHGPGRRRRARSTERALQRPPRSLRRQPRGRPQRHHRRRCAGSATRTRSTTSRRSRRSRPGCNPQVPVSDRRYYPIYQTCIDLDIPIIANAGHRRAAVPVGVPGRHALRPGLLRLPRAAHRDAPRRRAVGGAGGEAHAQVAGALLHDRARSRPSTTRRRSSTTPTRAAPRRSCTPATTRWA